MNRSQLLLFFVLMPLVVTTAGCGCGGGGGENPQTTVEVAGASEPCPTPAQDPKSAVSRESGARGNDHTDQPHVG